MSEHLSAGRLEDHPFAELSGLIFQENRTGELRLESGNRRRSVWFLGGNPVAVLSDDPQDHLAQFLLEHGKISDDEARRLANLPETREALGSAAFLNKETLNWGVKSRFVNLCYDLFRWEEGDYVFREGDPPRDLFLLKVPSHTLIFKGVGLLGLATVHDAVPDDAVCAAGPVAPADARYLSAEAQLLLERCRPGRTVAEALGDSSADPDQARRLLYSLVCLGLVALSRGTAAAPAVAPGLDEGPGFMLDEDEAETFTAPAFAEPAESFDPAGFSLGDQQPGGEFALNLPPLTTEDGAPDAPLPDFDPTGNLQAPGSYPFEEESGTGTFGTFNQDTSLDRQDEPAAPTDDYPEMPELVSTHAPRRFHLPRLVGIAIGALAAAGIIAVAGWWWLSGSEPPPPAVKPPVVQPLPKGGAPIAAAPTPEPAPLTQAALATPPAEPPIAPIAPVAPIAPALPAPEPAAAVSAPAQRPAGGASGFSGADRYRNALDMFHAGDFARAAASWEALLSEAHRTDYTLQLLTACQHDTIRDAQRSLSAHELYLVSKKVNGRDCFRVCLGTFDSRESAGRALAALPALYRTAGASVRPVAEVLDRDH